MFLKQTVLAVTAMAAFETLGFAQSPPPPPGAPTAPRAMRGRSSVTQSMAKRG